MRTSDYEERADRAQRFAEIWWKSRSAGKKSQEFMAMGLGVSKKTIQNWEKGTSSPSFFQGLEWFRLLGANPMPYYLSYFYPWLYSEEDGTINDENIEKILIHHIKQATPREKRQLFYLIQGRHGSSWFSLLQMLTAHCHSSMRSRVTAARIIKENYEMDEKTGNLVCPNEALPQIEMLESALMQGKQAAMNQKNSYTSAQLLNIPPLDQLDHQ